MDTPRLGFQIRRDDVDLVFVGAALTLIFVGTLAVFGSGAFQADAPGMHHFLVRHLERLALGLTAAVALSLFDHVRLRRAWLVYGAMAGGLVLTAIPGVFSRVGIDRWLEVPGLGQFQPIELAKLALVLFLAYRLSRPLHDRPLSGRSLAVTLGAGPVALMILLALQPNFGNVMVAAVVTGMLLGLAGLDRRWLVATLPLGALAAVAGYVLVSKLQTRIDQWWLGWRGIGLGDEPPFSYQVHQSLLGIGAGGWRGLGAGGSHNKYSFLPESHTDFAFSFVGEAHGLIGTLLVVAALVTLVWRALIIARRATTPFGRLLAAGFGVMLFVYGSANIAMVTGVIPVVGVPLPFVSYGGSALVTNLAALGIIVNVDRQSRGRRRRGP